MRIVNHILIKSFVAAEALIENRMVIWDPTDAESVRYPEGDGDTQIVGVTITAAASGEYVDVCMFGCALLKVDGNAANLLPGDPIKALSTLGLGVKATAAANVVGYTNEASTAANDEISVFVNPGYYAVS